MARILLLMLPEPGHILPSIHLAKTIQEWGNEVIYVLEEEFTEHATGNGFDVIPFDFTYASYECIPRFLKNRPVNKNHFFVAGFIKRIECLVNTCNPDVALIDEMLINVIICFRSFKIPVIILSTTQLAARGINVPPSTSGLIPDNRFFNKLHVNILWQILRLQKFFDNIRSSIWIFHYFPLFRLIMEYTHFPPDEIIWEHPFFYSIRHIPLIVLCFRTLDFPGKYDSCIYFYPGIDLQRKEPEFDWTVIKPREKLVYCSLGTQFHKHYTNYLLFFKKIIEIFRKKKNCNLILAIGNHLDKSLLDTTTDNIFIYQVVPQLEILKRADLMISHGGLGSIKEAILFEVPMLLFPVNLESEQNGNAARVVYHKLGLRGCLRKESRKKIEKKIDILLASSEFKNNIKKMKESPVHFQDTINTLSMMKSIIKECRKTGSE
ncbi:MAG: glycosyltransferase family 1 protein [Spirochaetales bacterium]|nr:glycosyltransferase family 1 protein [Spirochaetales bacterium]